MAPVRVARVTVGTDGIKITEMQRGHVRLANQTIAWSEMYALLGTQRKTLFGIELHTNGPRPGRRIIISLPGSPQAVRAARPYAKAAGYEIRPVFTKAFTSEEIWRLFKTD